MSEIAENNLDALDALPAGATIGGYAIRRMLGHGGFGITYEAHNRVTGKEVAIKEFFPSSMVRRDGQSRLIFSKVNSETIGWALRKFEETTTTLCGLSHPNIVQVHDYVPANDTGYMIMELVDGQTLKGWLASRASPPTLQELRPFVDPVMEALVYIHGRGLVHRDIAPDNILITKQGRPVLIDFGSVSRDLSDAKQQNVSSTVGLSKRYYTAPEQMRAKARPTPEADIYSMGGVLYKALTGGEPADGQERVDALFHGREADPYRSLMSQRPAGCPADAAQAIDKALAIRPEGRYHSVTALREALKPREAPPPEPSKTRWLVAGAVLVVLALIGGVLGGKALSDKRVSDELQKAQAELDRQQAEFRRQTQQSQDQANAAQQQAEAARQQASTARQRQADAENQAETARQQRDEAARQQETRKQEFDRLQAQRDEAARQQETRRQESDRFQAQRDEAARQQEIRRQESDRLQAQSNLKQTAANAAATFFTRHGYTAGDDLSSLAALYPASGQIDINGDARTAREQIAALERFYKSKRYTSFQIAVVPGTLAFDCDDAQRCIVKGQTRASYQTEDNASSRSSQASFCLRFDLRGTPKVLSEHSVKPGKDVTCG